MKKLIFAILSVFAGFACTETDELLPTKVESEQVSIPLQTRSASSTLPNPYSLANMQAAYNESVGSGTLQPNTLYVRFLPQDSLQMNRLKYDCFYQSASGDLLNLELFDYPLDIELEDGEVYIDPTIPGGQLTWQYTTVPTNFTFPAGITSQILEQCYIPSDFITRGDGTIVDLEAEAFERLGYAVEPETYAATRPTGTITVYDDSKGEYVPVKGVKIRCHTIIKWSTDHTDENGRYVMDSKFRIGPHYAVVFDNSEGFDIWGNWGPLARANYNMGWHSKNGHSRAFGTTSQGWKWSVVNNAGYEYYKMCKQTGISEPPSNLKIFVSDFLFNQGSAPMLRRVWHPIGINGNSAWVNFFSNLVVGSQATFWNTILKPIEPDITLDISGNYRRAYEMTVHELSHASHFSQVGSAYWAKYISYIITYGAYGNASSNNAELCGIGEMWAYAMEEILGYEKYQPTELTEYEPYPGSDDWFKPQVFWDLITDGYLTKRQIYDCLTPDVDTFAKLMAKMYQKYPAKADNIEAAFVRNGIIRNVNKPNGSITITGPSNPRPGGALTFTASAGAVPIQSIVWSIDPMTGVRSITQNVMGPNTCTIDFSSAAANQYYWVTATATTQYGQSTHGISFQMGPYSGEWVDRIIGLPM